MEKLESNLKTENEQKSETNNQSEQTISSEEKNEKKDNTNNLSDEKSNDEKNDKKSKEKNTEKKSKKNNLENFSEKNIEKKSTEKSKEKKSEIIPKKNNKKIVKKFIIIFLVILILIFLLLFSTIFALTTSNSDKIITGISVGDIDLSGLTKSEAEKKLIEKLNSNIPEKITVTHGEYSKIIETKIFGAAYSVSDSVEEAYQFGRNENNLFINNFNILNTRINKINLNPHISYNTESLDKIIEEINKELPDRVVNSNYEIKDNKLIISNSTNGYRVQRDKFFEQIETTLKTNTSSVEIPVEEFEADQVDIDAIHEQIYKEPKDASFTKEPFEIIKEEDGLDFAISLEEARNIVSQDKESFEIPLKKLTPKVTVKNLPSEAFPDTLATYSTTYASSNYNRSTNIALAASSINGYVLMPGESFSYNTTVGQRTPARGYKEAGVYVNGEVSTDYGGGICQVSSTLYNSVLLTNLEVVERTNHTFEPSYVPAGQDATVSWKSPDFIFKNNRQYPIKIIASAGNGRIQVDIRGVKSPDDYEVKIQSSKTGTIPFSTQYKDDSSLPAGTTKVTQYGSNGCKSVTYKILYKDGKEVSRTLLSSDTYKPHNQVVVRGTMAVPSPAPTPDSTPQPESPEPAPQPTTTSDSGVEITTDVPQE